MRFPVPIYTAAIFMTALSMGGLGMFVIMPIFFIQWTWNSVMSTYGVLPLINAWQATLLYLASATLLWLGGIVRIEFDPESEI